MNAVLPFDGFLDVLRTKGYAVGLRERFALASLLERWEGTSTGEFRDGLAALVGRSEAEVQGIRHLFDDFYKDHLEAPAAQAPPEPSPLEGGQSDQPAARTIPYRWVWTGAALGVLVIVIALGFAVRRMNQPTASAQPPAPPVAEPPSAAPSPPEPAIAAPAPPPLPEPPSILDWRVGAATSGVVFVVSMSVLWILKSREARRRWLRQMWSARLAALPGPHHFTLMVRDRPPGLARADVEDAATLLGRAFATEAPARELDVRRSLRLTLRHGLFPHVVFKRRRVTDAILVFQDVCQDMEAWQPKVDRFLTDVARQGVALDRYYFDGDIRRITHRPHRAPVPFDVVLGRRPDAAVLIISTGTALAPLLDQADDRWLIGLRNRRRRSWLSPLIDVRLWPTELGTLPIPVWPMTRLGLAQAAKDLAGIDGAVPSSLEQRIVSEGVVTQDGIERIKRLASLVPYPTMELLDALRVRFAPDVSDAVILHLIAETGTQPAPVLRLSDEELRRCLDAVRGETPRLEAAARQAIVETLRNSEPAAGSAAHLRWQAALSLQELVLADLRGADTTRALATLQELGQGPTWEEIRRAPRLVPSTPTLAEKLDTALGSDVGASDGGMPPSRFDSAAGRAPTWLWLRPGAREVVPAALLASFVFIGGSLFVWGAIPASRWLWPAGQLLELVAPVGGTIVGPGLRCGTRGSDCSTTRPVGDPVELEAQPDEGYVFSGWIGDCAPTGRLPMGELRWCGASFDRVAAPPPAVTFKLTITKPTGGTIVGEQLMCGTHGSECSADVPIGQQVTLMFQADTGWTFLQFTGDCPPDGEMTMTAAMTCGATFMPTTPKTPYEGLRRAYMDDTSRDLRIDQLAGLGVERVFRRKSGIPLSTPMPGLYTRDVFNEIRTQGLAKLGVQLTQEAWVRGESETTALASAGKIVSAVTREYELDYIRAWDALLDDLQFVPYRTIQQTNDALRILTAPTSPLRGLLRVVADNTTLVDPKSAPKGVVAETQKKVTDSVTGVLKPLQKAVGMPSVEPGTLVTAQFQWVRQLTAGEPGKTQLDRIIQSIADIQQQLDRPESAGRSPVQVLSSPSFRALMQTLQQQAAALPPGLRTLVSQIPRAVEDGIIAGPPRVQAEPLAVKVPPAEGGLEPLPKETQKDYQKRMDAMRARYDNAVSMLQKRAYVEAERELAQIGRAVPSGYLDLAQRLAAARYGVKNEAEKKLDVAQKAEPTSLVSDRPAEPRLTAEQQAKDEIEQLVKNYCAALESLDTDRIKEWFPLAPLTELRGQFSQYKSLTCTPTLPLEYERLDARPAGGAQVKFGMKQIIQMRSAGTPRTFETIVTMVVSRTDLRSPWLIDFLRHEVAKQPIEELYKQQIVPTCRRLIADRYPFANSPTDVQLADFATVFGYDGLFDKFFADHLEKQVDTSGPEWTRRPSAVSLSSQVLAQFQAARRIRDMFFSAGSKTPEVGFFVTFSDLDSNAQRFVLQIDGKNLDDQHSKQPVVWPGSSPGRAASTFESRYFEPTKTYAGPWAWFRMIDATREGAPDPQQRIRLKIQSGYHFVRVTVEPSRASDNPFATKEWRQFSCGS